MNPLVQSSFMSLIFLLCIIDTHAFFFQEQNSAVLSILSFTPALSLWFCA